MASAHSANPRRVDFVIAGAQKSGTSALHAYLGEHPEICMAKCKEVHFFDNDNYFIHGQVDYAKYHAFFLPSESQRLLGEATPIYMYWRSVPERLWQYNPALKIIIVLRNPIDRAHSQWNMWRARGKEQRPFYDAVKAELEGVRSGLADQTRASYVDRGFYVSQLQRIWKYFPIEQTLIIKYDEFVGTQKDTLNKICDFIGAKRIEWGPDKIVHQGSYASQMTEQEWTHLRGVFESEIVELGNILGWNCSDWLEPPRRSLY
jgi:hypothetical protein